MNPSNPIRVLSIDDSAFFRRVLAEILGQHDEIELIGCAGDPFEARDQLLTSVVDVLTLDLDLPRVDGIEFLKLMMERKPMPVIVLSSSTRTGSERAVEALIAGAFDVIEKPDAMTDRTAFAERLIEVIKSAAAAPLRRRRPQMLDRCPSVPHEIGPSFDPRQIIAIGASTGGTQAIEEVLTMLPDGLPGMVIVQHIPAGFSASFADRLDDLCAMEVREARDGDVLHSGLVLIAPGDRHIEVAWQRDRYRVRLSDGPPVDHHRPSVDVLFESLAAQAGPQTVAVLLTGMGRDGATGMKHLHDRGARTIAQDAGSSVVYGMPRKAIELKAVDSIASLENIAGEILSALEQQAVKTPDSTYA